MQADSNQSLDLSSKRISALQENLSETEGGILDFCACLSDVSYNMQNYAFSELLKDELDKRKVSDEKYLTIDTLIKKHNIES